MILTPFAGARTPGVPGPAWLPTVCVALAGGVLVMGGCARQGAPTGGQPPAIPPSVVATTPDTFAILPDFRDGVVIRYNRPISERAGGGSLPGLVDVSPRLGEVEVRNRGNSVEISMDGGFPSGRVYRVSIQPGITDLYGQATEEPFELVFSTGAPFHPNVVAGVVEDRITGQVATGARVEAFLTGDTIPLSAVTDRDGIFALRYVPSGEVRLRSYLDRARNFQMSETDPRDSVTVELAEGDTVMVFDLALLLPDSTPAVLGAAQVEDSLTLRLTFDDHLDPDWDPGEASVTLSREDGGAVPEVMTVLHPAQQDSLVALEREAQAEREAAAREAETEAARQEAEAAVDEEEIEAVDEAAQAEETRQEAEGELGAQADIRGQARAPAEPPLPQPLLYTELSAPLDPETEYQVIVAGVRNVNGLPDGGGEVQFRTPAPPPLPEPDSVPPPPDGG
ncbi:MAG: Ig-like domain-containing protein [Gemmatimonadota bacterium]